MKGALLIALCLALSGCTAPGFKGGDDWSFSTIEGADGLPQTLVLVRAEDAEGLPWNGLDLKWYVDGSQVTWHLEEDVSPVGVSKDDRVDVDWKEKAEGDYTVLTAVYEGIIVYDLVIS